MIRKKIVIIAIIIGFFSNIANATISVLPYRVISQNGMSKLGNQYASLLTSAIKLKYAQDVESQQAVLLDIRNFIPTGKERLSKKILNKYGKIAGVNYIITGDIAYEQGVYVTTTILFSVKENRVILRSKQMDRSIYKLAEQELVNILSGFKLKRAEKDIKKNEIVILFDSSYNINSEWRDLKNGILKLSSTMIEKYGRDTKIYLVPYQNDTPFANASVSENSTISLKRELAQIHPKGNPHKKSLRIAIKYAINGVHWNSKADKTILIIDNTPFQGDRFLGGYALRAKRMGIKINVISLALSHPKRVIQLQRLADISGGSSSRVIYHQTVESGEKRMELYSYGSNFFVSDVLNLKWRESIFKNPNGIVLEPKAGIREIPFYRKNIKASPYTMARQFNELTKFHLIVKKHIETNLVSLIKRIITDSFVVKERLKPIARVLLSNNGITIWRSIFSPKVLLFIKNKKRAKSNIWSAIEIRKNKKSIYNVDFNVVDYTIPHSFVSEKIIVDLSSVIKSPHKYLHRGLFNPSIWFIKFKIEKINVLNTSIDIRD